MFKWQRWQLVTNVLPACDHLGEGQYVEVAQVAVCHEGPAASWRALGRHKLDICQHFEGVVPGVPPSPVHELAQELNWGLHAESHHVSAPLNGKRMLWGCGAPLHC